MKFSRPYLELLRLPNLFTLPGDILVGWCLSGMRGWFPLCGILASLCLYACGLFLNDFFDADIDAKERPERPIPSGRIPKKEVLHYALLLAAIGILLAGRGALVAVLLLALIFFYNRIAKHLRTVGVVTMGLCRGMNIFLGVAVTWPIGEMPFPPVAIHAAVFFTLYILLVSIIAKDEAVPHLPLNRLLKWSPLILVLSLVPWAWWQGFSPYWLIFVCVTLIVLTLHQKRSIQQHVGSLLRLLIPLQLLWCLLIAPTAPFIILFALLFLGAILTARRYAGS
ncbi:MAG: UbiA family prenyltransferase [Kiritimatiellia bacterium]